MEKTTFMCISPWAMPMLAFASALCFPVETVAAGPDAVSDGLRPVQEYNGVYKSAAAAREGFDKPLSVTELSETEIPSGEDKVYSTDWMCLMYDYIVDNTGIASTVRYTDDGKVWFHDFFSLGKDYWIEGTVSDNVITIPMHQKMGVDAFYGEITLELSRFVLLPNGNSTSEIDREAEAYTLLIQPDGSIISPDLDKEWTERDYPVLVNSEDGVFALCGAMTMTPVADEPVSPPADLETTVYSFSYVQDNIPFSGLCDVGREGNSMYIKGLFRFLPDTWLKGDISDDGKSVVFRSGQYLGHKLYHYYFTAAHQQTEVDENNDSHLIWVKDGEFEFHFDEDGETLTFNRERYFTATIAGDITFVIYGGKLSPFNDEARIPAKPIIDDIYWMEADFLIFTQPLQDIDGKYLSPESLSWRMYYDDELFTFDSADYMNVETPMTEVPYGTDDNYDFLFMNNIEQAVAIYRTDYKNIGIESICTVNGERKVSERAYYGTTSVGAGELTFGKILRTEYYDLAGKRVNAPVKGVYICRTVFESGEVRIHKIVR